MSATMVGEQFTTPILQPGYPRSTRDATGAWTREYLYLVKKELAYDAVEAQLATIAADIPATLGAMLLREISITEDSKPGLAELSLKFTSPDQDLSSSHVPGVIVTEIHSDIQEKPVEEHPQFAALSPANKTKLAASYKTFSFGTSIYTRTETFDRRSFKLTEAVAREGLNATSAPPGLQEATAANWMKFKRSIRKQKATVEITDEWHYNQAGWEDTITYNTTSEELTAILNKLPEV